MIILERDVNGSYSYTPKHRKQGHAESHVINAKR